MMAVGFTGTSKGMSVHQKADLRNRLLSWQIAGATEFHHGDCVGADAEADQVARSLGYRIVIHPPIDPKARAFCESHPDDVVHAPKPYLERNHDIVDAVAHLLAAPRTDREQVRSGTWATVRYARKAGKRITVLPR